MIALFVRLPNNAGGQPGWWLANRNSTPVSLKERRPESESILMCKEQQA